MELQNDPNGKKTETPAQTVSPDAPAKLAAEPIEDIELNEEQLDIISGGGDVFIRIG